MRFWLAIYEESGEQGSSGKSACIVLQSLSVNWRRQRVSRLVRPRDRPDREIADKHDEEEGSR